MEPVELDETDVPSNKKTSTEDNVPDASGAASEGKKTSSENFPDVDASSLHSRDSQPESQTHHTDDDEEDEDSDENQEEHEAVIGGAIRPMINGFYYKPLLYYQKSNDKTFYYKYFKPYSYDLRVLQMDQDCQCEKGKFHETTCSWYDPDIINILETKTGLSISGKAAQQKIYQLYQQTINNPPEDCGCGTAAAIAYMGHHTGCIEFLHLHERESHEVLLAILKKKKKMTFHSDSVGPKKAKLDIPVNTTVTTDVTTDNPQTVEVSTTNSTPPLSQTAQDSLSVLAVIASTAPSLPENPPNSLPTPGADAVVYGEERANQDEDKDEEMPPLEDID